jgi:hypothetical protein
MPVRRSLLPLATASSSSAMSLALEIIRKCP